MGVTFPVSRYIEQRNGGLYIAGTRVSLDSVVIHFRDGRSPERIVRSFPTLELALVYGAIAYYLENQRIIDEYIAEGERELRRTVPTLQEANPELYARLEAARRKMSSKQS
jgi:uncharacterized protein (DUF433 family)